jgi:serine/threonine protein kinase
VLKVFKKGTFLRDLQFQVPHGYLNYHAKIRESVATLLPMFQSKVVLGILLEDGRFAFLMVKEHFDLRYVIDRNMKSRCGYKVRGPFSKDEVEYIMYHVALGVDWLHNHNIVHRDLKASNVLVQEYESGYPKWHLSVADFECSIGVERTGFFRASEIL